MEERDQVERKEVRASSRVVRVEGDGVWEVRIAVAGTVRVVVDMVDRWDGCWRSGVRDAEGERGK